ncbi:MAG: MFS transporter [Candidatus Njordarchaeia archaeon]
MVVRRGLSKFGRIVYSMGRLGSTTLLTVVSLTSYYYYLNFVQVDPFVNGLAHSFSKILMAIIGLLFGYLSDRFVFWRLGKRRLYIVVGSIVLSVSFLLLYNPLLLDFKGDKFFVVFYEFVCLTFLGVGYSALIIPYQAWMPEITVPDERAEVSFYQNVFNFAGNIIGIGASFSLSFLIASNYPIFYQFVIIVATLEVFLYLPSVVFISDSVPSSKSSSFLEEIKIVVGDRNFVSWEVTRGFSSAGVTIYIVMIVDFITNYLDVVKMEYLLDGILITLTVIFSIPLIFRVSRRYGMKRVMYYSLMLLSISLIILSLVPKLDEGHFMTRFGLFLTTLSVIGLIGYWIFNYAITANIIDVNMLRTGESRAGTYTGIDNINVNFFQSTGYFLLGVSLKYLVSFSELIWSLVAGLLILISLVPFKCVEIEVENDSNCANVFD